MTSKPVHRKYLYTKPDIKAMTTKKIVEMTLPDSAAAQTFEQVLEHGIKALYQEKLGHQPTTVTCQLFDQKLVIIMERTLSQPELLLISSQQQPLAEQVRSSLDNAIRPHLRALIEQVLSVEVADLLVDTTLATERTGGIAVLLHALTESR